MATRRRRCKYGRRKRSKTCRRKPGRRSRSRRRRKSRKKSKCKAYYPKSLHNMQNRALKLLRHSVSLRNRLGKMRLKRSGTSDPVKRLMIEADINSLDKEKKLVDAKSLKIKQKLDADSATYAGKNSINYEVQKLENIKYMNKIPRISK